MCDECGYEHDEPENTQMSLVTYTERFAFNPTGGATICLDCASQSPNPEGTIVEFDAFPDGFTCDDCWKVFLH